MSKKLTPWFFGIQRPARVGVYQVRSLGYTPGDLYFSYWDGTRFNGCWPDAEYAQRRPDWGVGLRVGTWRGLAKKP
jgi:hypothetical protein